MAFVNKNITDVTTRCIARFFAFKNRETLSEDNTERAMDTEVIIEDDAIISCSITKQKSSPTGNFTLVLKPKKNYYNMIRPGDWVMIYLDDIANIDIKELKGVKLVGIVNRCAFNKVTLQNGTVVNTFTISGSDFGKIFQVTEFFYNPYADEAFLQTFIGDLDLKIQGSPVDFVNSYMDMYLGRDERLKQVLFQILIPSTLYAALKKEDNSKGFAVSFNDIVTRQFNDNAAEGFSLFQDATRINNISLWECLQSVSNNVVNELFIDTIDGQPTLMFQKQPLKTDDALKMAEDAIELPEKYILNYNLGLSDHEVFNFLAIYAAEQILIPITYYASAELKDSIPSVYKDSIKRFGLRQIDRTTEYAMDKDKLLFDQIKQWVEELREFWFNCYHHETGTIEVVGKSDFNIGKFIKIPELKKIYRIENIDWNWSFGENLVTTLSVTYGLNEDGSYIDQTKEPDYNLEGTGYYRRLATKSF